MRKKNRYWIATYSAHADILQQIVDEDGVVEKLCVDCGGLRAPKGASYRRGLLKNLITPSKTLHAKILLKDTYSNNPEIWLWTGNIRKATFDSQNILLSFPIHKRELKPRKYNTLINWFDNLSNKALCRNMIFFSDGKSITDLFVQEKQNLWSELKERIMNLLKDDIVNCKFYAISPWGSAKFVNSILELGFKEVNFYSRFEEDCIPIWIDCIPLNSQIPIKRWIADKNGVFPHLKCMFITKVNAKGSESLVWTYIGSANFTQKAMFEKKNSNIEHALLFEGKEANCSVTELFDKLINKYSDSKNNGWKERKLKIPYIKDCKYDESKNSVADESDFYENIENFKRRDFCQEIMPFLLQKNVQNELDNHYKNKGTEWYDLKRKTDSYRIKINSVDDCYHIMAMYSKKASSIYDIDVPRIIEKEIPLNCTDANDLLKSLLTEAKNAEKVNGSLKVPPPSETVSNDKSSESINIRFIAKKFFDRKGNLKKSELEKTHESLKKIEPVWNKLEIPYKTMFSIWKNMIDTLKDMSNE